MPIADTSEARDLIIGVVQSAINTMSPVPKVMYADKADEIPKDGKTWIRVSATHIGGRKASLTGAIGVSRYRSTGICKVEVHTPFGDGYALSDALTQIVKQALRVRHSSADKVAFSNVRLAEWPKGDGDWTRVDVNANFVYDEFG